MTAFTVNRFTGKEEIASAAFDGCETAVDQVAVFLALALTFGIERTEAALYETFPAQGAQQIILMANTALKLAA